MSKRMALTRSLIRTPRSPTRPTASESYVNASDLLEEFIDFVDGVGGIDKERFLSLPIETFIRWLVLRAAQADGESLEDEQREIEQSVIALPTPAKIHRIKRNCKCCGRFVSRRRADNAMLFCSADHYARFEEKVCVGMNISARFNHA